MDVAVRELMELFLQSPLVAGVKTLSPVASGNDEHLYMHLVDGILLHQVMSEIDPRPNQRFHQHVNNDVNLRIENLTILVRHIENFYQEVLQQRIVMSLPDVSVISKDPLSGQSMEEMEKMLVLVLGCAVQCDRKGEFIEKIQQLDIETQVRILAHIRQVTRHQESLFDMQRLEVPDMALEELESLSSNTTFCLRRLVTERDSYRELVVTMTQEWNTCSRLSEDTQHLAVELADTKATLRSVRQELEENTKQLADARHQLYQLVLELQEARRNNMELAASAQAARAPLPELDSLREKARRVERLEMGLRQKQKDIDFYAARMKELIEDNYTLMDIKGLLQEQLTVARSRVDKLYELEEENVQLKSKLHRLHLARDTDQQHLEELREENLALKAAQGQSVEESTHLRWELEQLSCRGQRAEAEAPGIWALTPLCSSASSCFLKLDQEKQSLQGTIQGLRDASLALQESSLQRQELEKENQQLRKQIEDLRVQVEREKQTSQDLETLSEELMEEREQLLHDIETLKAEKAQEIKDLEQVVRSLRERSQASSEACVQDIENESKVLHQTVMETSSRVSKLEREQQQLHQDLEQVKEQATRAQELEQELHRLQEENEMLAMEVSALRTAPKRVHALERESPDLLLENQRLQTSLDTLQPKSLERDEQLDTRVENSTLSSQSASLTALTEQNMQLQHQQLVAAHEALQREHACLGALHEHLSGEHEALMDEYSRQKTLLRRTLELESKALSDREVNKSTITLSDVELVRLEAEGQEGPPGEKGVPTNPGSGKPAGVFPFNRYKDQLQHKAAQEQLGTLLTTEREALQQEQRTSAMAAEENQRLQRELDRANSLHQQLKGEQEELQTHNKKLQTSLNDTQLEVNRWQALYEGLKGEHEDTDISLTEQDNHCQLLSRLKGNLEGEKRDLQSQIQRLKEQNQRLFQEDMENKDQLHEEQQQYVDKLNALQRQNEKLEEKSMAQHNFHDPAPKKKKHWIGAKFLLKLIKLKKGGSRERRKSTPERPPWPLGSSDQASPSTSQPLQSQLEPLEATPCCSKGTEEQGTCRGPRGKGPGDLIPKGVAPPRGSLDRIPGDASADPATKPRPSELGSGACSSSAITTAPSSSTSTSRHPGRTHGPSQAAWRAIGMRPVTAHLGA
ncbi:protein Daple-like [Myotis daubentonii]|uniref:protein Daple-like n=1 Tax=Myotis daubentonii TaxID=98922 RepID=UPI0028734FC7|nr:protein Daple-like [Myotis daubentonii]